MIYDFVIIGGGISGLYILDNLKKIFLILKMVYYLKEILNQVEELKLFIIIKILLNMNQDLGDFIILIKNF